MHEILQIGVLLALIIGAVVTFYRFRGRHFGVSDLLIFGVLAVVADVVCFKLFHVVAGPHADSEAYGALVALLVLFGLVPLAAGFSLVAFLALCICMARYPMLRLGVLILLVGAVASSFFTGQMRGGLDEIREDRLAGEYWAQESGATSRKDCDRHSSAPAFREGCYVQLHRMGVTAR